MCHWDRQAPSPNSIVTIGRFKTRPPNSMVTMGRSETRPPNSMVTIGRSETCKIHRTHAKNIHWLILLYAFRLFDGSAGPFWHCWDFLETSLHHSTQQNVFARDANHDSSLAQPKQNGRLRLQSGEFVAQLILATQ